MADSAAGRSVHFPALEPEHASAVRSTLGPLVKIANPLDYHTFIWNREAEMEATFAAMVGGGFDLNLLVLDFPRSDRCSDADWWTAANAFQKALAAGSAKGAIVASMTENLPGGFLRGGIGAHRGGCDKLVNSWLLRRAYGALASCWRWRGLSCSPTLYSP